MRNFTGDEGYDSADFDFTKLQPLADAVAGFNAKPTLKTLLEAAKEITLAARTVPIDAGKTEAAKNRTASDIKAIENALADIEGRARTQGEQTVGVRNNTIRKIFYSGAEETLAAKLVILGERVIMGNPHTFEANVKLLSRAPN